MQKKGCVFAFLKTLPLAQKGTWVLCRHTHVVGARSLLLSGQPWSPSNDLLWRQHDAFILFALDDLERVVEMLLAILDRRRVLLIPGKVGVDQFDEPVEVLGSYLGTVSVSMMVGKGHA